MGWTTSLILSAGIFLFAGHVWGAPLQKTESLGNIEKLKTKLESLHNVLSDLESDLSTYETRGLERQQDAAKDAELEDFENQLSEADRELVNKMKSRVKYLQTALHTAAAVDERDQADEKRGQSETSGLSEQDQAMLKKYPSYAHFLEAEKKMPHTNDDDQYQTGTDDKRGSGHIIDPSLRAFLEQLSPEDRKLLQDHPSKANALKSELQSKAENKEKNSETEVELLESIKAKLGELKQSLDKERSRLPERQIEDSSHEGWMQGPVDNDSLGINAKCKEGENCNDKKCKAGEDCNEAPSHKQLVEDVRKKLLGDMAYAKKNGVSTNEILEVLMTANRARRMIDEAEQEQLEFEDLANRAFM